MLRKPSKKLSPPGAGGRRNHFAATESSAARPSKVSIDAMMHSSRLNGVHRPLTTIPSDYQTIQCVTTGSKSVETKKLDSTVGTPPRIYVHHIIDDTHRGEPWLHERQHGRSRPQSARTLCQSPSTASALSSTTGISWSPNAVFDMI